MTVCVSVKINYCLVFAADSAITYALNGEAVQNENRVYEHGDKVFNLRRDLPICAMFSGQASIGRASISSVVKDFRLRAKDASSSFYIDPGDYTISDVAEQARKYIIDERIGSLSAGAHRSALNFWVGGYGSTHDAPEVWRLDIVDGVCAAPSLIQDAEASGWSASGEIEPLSRLLLGYSQRIPHILLNAGVPSNVVTHAMAQISHTCGASLVEPSMPIADAIALSTYLVETVKGYVNLSPGADVVGGVADLAVVTKHEGFKWIRRKHYYPKSLNEETDHA